MSFNLLTIERDHLQVSFSLYERVNLESLFRVYKNTLSKGNNNNISVRSPLLAETEKSQTQQKREKITPYKRICCLLYEDLSPASYN